MRKWLARSGVILTAFVLATGVVSAQDNTPPLGQISTLEAGDFRALAVTHDGDRLLVADGENNQVRIYDFTDPAKPELLSSLDVSGTPVLLAGGENFGLAAVTTDGETDSVEVVAPPLAGAGAEYAPGINYIDIPKNPRALALSPDNHWGIAVSERGYTLMQINSPSDIGSIPISDTIIDAALSDTTAYLLRDQNLEAAPLDNLEAMSASQSLALGGVPSLVALNADVTAGVVVLDGSRLVFFDPTTLEKTGEFALRGKPITSVHFLTNDGDQYLVVTRQDDNAVTVLNVADPQKVALLPAMQSLDKPIRALAIFQRYLILTDGVTINIFSA